MTRCFSTGSIRDDHPKQTPLRRCRGEKLKFSRGSYHPRTHRPLDLFGCEKYLGRRFLVRVMEERDERDCEYPGCMVIHGGQWCCVNSWCTNTWCNTIALRERVERG